MELSSNDPAHQIPINLDSGHKQPLPLPFTRGIYPSPHSSKKSKPSPFPPPILISQWGLLPMVLRLFRNKLKTHKTKLARELVRSSLRKYYFPTIFFLQSLENTFG